MIYNSVRLYKSSLIQLTIRKSFEDSFYYLPFNLFSQTKHFNVTIIWFCVLGKY